MPFFTDDEDDDYDDGSRALKTKDAMRESARNVITTLHNDISNPRMYIQEVDDETGFPVRKHLVSGGIENFNDTDFGLPDAAEYNVDAVLSGDVSIEDAMAMVEGTAKQPARQTVLAPHPNIGSDTDIDLARFGLAFLKSEIVQPDKHVRIAFLGPASFQVPFFCHEIVTTPVLAVLVTDKRAVPGTVEMDFHIDRNTTRCELVLADGTAIPVLPPVPHSVSFEIGVLRCTIFARITDC